MHTGDPLKKLVSSFAFVCLSLGFSLNARAQNLTTVSASNIQDVNGAKLAAGQLCFLITDQNDAPISTELGGGGQVLRRSYCTPVVNGGVTSFTVPNPANTQPAGIYYRITVKDTSTGQEVLRYTQVSFVGATFNFDNYAPTFPSFIPPMSNATVGNLSINGNLSVTGSMTFTPSALTASNATINQAANGNDAIFGKRATDTSPTGNFEHFRNSANTADLWTVDVTGTLQSGTVPTARLSGTFSGSQLPNPSPTTLGGVESFAPVSHQWINSISTSGVPAGSQPAAADLSNGTTGSGAVVLATSPALVTPNIGAAAGSTLTFPNQAAPANPSAGNIVIYGDSGTGNLACRNSAGGNCNPASPPFISSSANPAATGILRVASSDTAIAFRNNANTADIVGLSKNTSDIVSVGGSAGITTLGPLTLGATDAGLSRTAAASVAVGNGAAGDSSGTLLATTVTLPSTGLIKIGSSLGISNFGNQVAFGNGTVGSTSAILQAGSAQLNFGSTSGYDLGVATLGVYTLGSNGVRAWTPGAANQTSDTGLSRISAGVVALGNGTQGNVGGELRSTRIAATYNAAGTLQTAVHIVEDTCTLGTSCAVTLAGSAAFTSASTYRCAANDATAANAVRVNQASGTSVTFTGTGTDVISFVCVGN
jgi:hypothetical protein